MTKTKKNSPQLADLAQSLLAENWPSGMKDKLALAEALDCSAITLNNVRTGLTRNPGTRLSQRIYEHYTGLALLD